MIADRQPKKRPLAEIRDDVVINRVGPDAFQVSLGASGKLLRINGRERVLLDLIVQSCSVDEVVRSYPSRLGRVRRHDVTAFLIDADKLGLTGPAAKSLPGRLVASKHGLAADTAPTTQTLNACFDFLVLLFGWMLSRWVVVPLLGALSLLAAFVLAREGSTITSDLANLHADSHWVPLAAMVYLRLLLVISLPTAIVVGVAVRRGGGWLRGFRLSLWEDFLPLFEVETGESLVWMAAPERRRVIGAALLTPLAILSGSLVAWSACTDYYGPKALWLLMIPPAAVAFLLRCNPFAKTPAYWLLCDAWDDWRLQDEAEAETQKVSPFAPSRSRLQHRRRCYAQCRQLFRAVRNTALLIAGVWLAVAWLEGVGAILATLAILWWNRSRLSRLLRPWLLAPVP